MSYSLIRRDLSWNNPSLDKARSYPPESCVHATVDPLHTGEGPQVARERWSVSTTRKCPDVGYVEVFGSGRITAGSRKHWVDSPKYPSLSNCHFPRRPPGFHAESPLYGTKRSRSRHKSNTDNRGGTLINTGSESYRLQGTEWAELRAPGNLRTRPDSLAREPPSFLWAETCLRDGSLDSADRRQASRSVSGPSATTRGAFYRARRQFSARVWPPPETVSDSPPTPAHCSTLPRTLNACFNGGS